MLKRINTKSLHINNRHMLSLVLVGSFFRAENFFEKLANFLLDFVQLRDEGATNPKIELQATYSIFNMTVIDWFVIILQFVALAVITINLTLIVIYIIFRIIRKLKKHQ